MKGPPVRLLVRLSLALGMLLSTAVGLSLPAQATAIIALVPNAPTDLVATPASVTEVSLTWVDNSTDENSFRVERSTTQGSGYGEIASLAADTTSYSDTGAQCGTTYYYQVIAVNVDGDSPPSNEATTTTPACAGAAPAAPSNLAATANAPTTIGLSWTDNSADETGFKVERSTTQGSGFTAIATADADATSYSDTGAQCGTAYFYRVIATNGSGDSAPSNEASATTPACSGGSGNLVIEVSQVLGNQFDRYVAGKDTGVLVYLENEVAVDAAQQKVVVKRDGTTVTTLEPLPSEGTTKVLTFLCPNRPACGDWQAGSYSFEASINGVTASKTNVVFQVRRALRVLAVPVKVKFGGVVKAVATDAWKTAGNFMRQVYPVAPENYQWEIGQELDLSAQTIDVLTDAGQLGVWKALANLQPKECRDEASRGANCYDKIIGFLAERPGNLNGYTYGDPANVVAIQSGMARTVAHEVGHNFRLGDEYNGGQFNCDINPTPPSFQGKDFNRKAAAPFSCTDASVQAWEENGTASRIVAATMRPFEVGGRGLLPDKGNFMGNLNDPSQAWTSPNAWRQVFDQLAPQPANVGLAAATRVVLASGLIATNGSVELGPWYTYDSDTTPSVVSSPYRIQALNGANVVLASRTFELEYDLPDQVAELSAAPFEVEVPFPAGTSAYRILKGPTSLVTVPVSANIPSVTVTAPSGGQSVAGVTTITWSGSDADGGTLYYDVEYNPTGNEADWVVLASELTATEWTDDFSTLPGGTQARIRVTVSDGINSSTATSGIFSVPASAPEVYVYDPVDGASYTAGEEVFFEGEGYDDQDGWLYDDTSLSWSSDKDGVIGTGFFLVVDSLSVGEHTITLTAKNSLGLTSSAQVKLTITGRTSGGKIVYLPVVRK